MLLKYQDRVDCKDNKEIKSYIFTDSKKTEYYFQHRSFDFIKGDLYKIRSIQKIEPNNVLYLQKRSSVMHVPKHFVEDWKRFESLTYPFFYNT